MIWCQRLQVDGGGGVGPESAVKMEVIRYSQPQQCEVQIGIPQVLKKGSGLWSLGSTFCWTTACLKDWRTLAAFQGATDDGQCFHGTAREQVEAFTVQIL